MEKMGRVVLGDREGLRARRESLDPLDPSVIVAYVVLQGREDLLDVRVPGESRDDQDEMVPLDRLEGEVKLAPEAHRDPPFVVRLDPKAPLVPLAVVVILEKRVVPREEL